MRHRMLRAPALSIRVLATLLLTAPTAVATAPLTATVVSTSALLAPCVATALLAGPLIAGPAQARTPDLAQAAGTYDIGAASQIRFSVDQVGGGGIQGSFTKFSGRFQIDGGNVATSSVSFTLYPQSVSTAEGRMEDFLRSSAVFDAASYPTVTFRSTAVRQTGDDTAVVDGMLTARGITHREQFAVRLQQLSGRQIAFNVTGKVYRSRYKMDVGTPIYLNIVKFDMDIRGQRR